LQDEGGRGLLFPADDLAMNLRRCGVRLAVLGAGEAGRRDQVNAWTGVARSLTRAGIPAVVGMQYPIRDTSATAFYQGFYRALAAGQPIDAAVTDGRLAILNRSSEDDRDWGVPVLTMRSLDGVLFPQAPPEPSPPTPTPSKPSRPVNPFIYDGPIKDQRYFFGRAAETRQVLQRVAQGQSVSIVGPRRIGKTSFLFHLSDPQVRAAHRLDDEFVFVYADCQGMSNLTESDVYRALLEYITEATPSDRGVEYGSQAASPYSSLRTYLRKITRLGLRIALLLDEFEMLASSPQLSMRFYDELRALTAMDEVVYVTATTETLDSLMPQARSYPSSPFFNIFESVRLGLMQPEEARALVDGLAATVDFQGFDEDDHAFLRGIAGLHPFYLQMAASILFEERAGRVGLAPPDYDRVRLTFNEQVEDHFRYAWERLSDDEREALGLIAEGLVDKVPPEHRVRLEHECLVYQGAIFSSSFAEFVQRRPG
jgi:hypothetical protein